MISTKLDHNKIKNHINDRKTIKNIPELIRFKLSLAACACFCPLDCVSSVIISPTAVEDACKPPIKREEGKKCQRFFLSFEVLLLLLLEDNR